MNDHPFVAANGPIRVSLDQFVWYRDFLRLMDSPVWIATCAGYCGA